MANYNTIVVPERGIPCTAEQADAITAYLEAETEEDDGWMNHGFRFLFEDGEGFFEAEESGNIDEVPEPAIKALAKLIQAAGWPYLEFGVAYTCSRLIPNSHGGGAFRLYPDGTVVVPQVIWPDTVGE